jgi:hypothetical protein
MVKQHDVEEWGTGKKIGKREVEGLKEGRENHVKREEPERDVIGLGG